MSETHSGDADAVAEPVGSNDVVELADAEPEPIAGNDVVEPADAEPEPTATKAKVPAAGRAVNSGRVTPKGGATVRQPVTSGRYTPPIPRQQRQSPRWFPIVLLGFLVLGLVMIVLNYVNVLPGGTNNWYLIGGIGSIVVGLFMATFYH